MSAVVEGESDGSDGSPGPAGYAGRARWPVAVAVAGAVGLQVLLTGAFTPGHREPRQATTQQRTG